MPVRLYPQDIPALWRNRYSRMKAQAKFRRHEWAWDIDSWYKFWCDSGVKEHMGKLPHQYCMVRIDEIEAWGPHNCLIVARRKFMKKHAFEKIWKNPPADWEPRHAVAVGDLVDE